jgi:hypothetical protein
MRIVRLNGNADRNGEEVLVLRMFVAKDSGNEFGPE